MWALCSCLGDGHRGADPEGAGLVRCRRDDTPVPDATDDDRLAAQRGLVPLLDSGVERVKVDVQDARPITPAHAAILAGDTDRPVRIAGLSTCAESGSSLSTDLGPQLIAAVFASTLHDMNLTERAPLRVRGPGDVAVVLPYLLGFQPVESLVVLPVHKGPPIMRVDLPPVRPALFASQVAETIKGVGLSEAVLTLFTADARLAARHAGALQRVLGRRSVQILEMLRVHGGRWWSLTCDGACCPADGTPYDAATTALAAQATVAGLTVLPTRAALEHTLAPIADECERVAASVRSASGEVRERVTGDGPSQGTRWLDEDGRRRVLAAVARFEPDGPRSLGSDEIAWLVVHTRSIEMRDYAWLLIRPDDVSQHVDLWAYVVRRVPPPLRPPTASLLAAACYLSGSGVLAHAALDIALSDDPGYSMALLLRDVVDRALPPSAWWAAS